MDRGDRLSAVASTPGWYLLLDPTNSALEPGKLKNAKAGTRSFTQQAFRQPLV